MCCRGIVLTVALLIQVLPSTAIGGDVACQVTERFLIRHFSDLNDQREILSQFNIQLQKFQPVGIKRSFCEELQMNLTDKFPNNENPLKLTAKDIIKHGILFESFRITTYLTAGVAPKRYFGFFDERGTTANFERILRITIINAVRITNEYAAASGLTSRITEKEVALTFLAEGGALLLTNPEHSPNRVHPIREVGLDDFRAGFSHFPGLVERFDHFFGTKLGSLTLPFFGRSVLLRPMTFRESILGTTLMYLYEKELTANSMRAQWSAPLMDLSLDEQFISTSLVYNSGILFSAERVKQIAKLTTGEYLAMVNEKSNRPRLPVCSPEKSLERLRSHLPVPIQLTSWSAVYHILQRYGAWIALEKFSDTFKDEAFVDRV